MKSKNPLRSLSDYGQSVWLDYIRRSLILSGELRRLIEEDGLRGVTSNPAIFAQAITGSTDYHDLLEAPEARTLDAKALYETIAVRDIQDAADLLRPVYLQSRRRDGYVSLEVSPLLAHDTLGTVAEARRLWHTVARENLMVKVPATPAGIPAIEQLISEGVNVNVTLLFSQRVYEQVAKAYLSGLERYAATHPEQTLSTIASVASFFISRIDTLVDNILAAKLKTAARAGEQSVLRSLLGQVAIANARLTYQHYLTLVASPRWRRLAAHGAQTQRLLWASTSTKNPHYRDVLYVEELIGPDTVNTIPPATFGAFRDHGGVRASLTEDLEAAYDTMAMLSRVGVSMEEITETLLADGVRQFAEAFDKLLKATDRKDKAPAFAKINRQTFSLPVELAAAVNASLQEWKEQGKVQRLWARDASLWTGADEGHWLGWLDVADDQLLHAQHLQQLADEVRSAGFSHALLLGMGGSSLCPEVMSRTFGKREGYPELHILDSTDPAQVKAVEDKIDLAKTLFIVSSKSGSTLEPNIFKQYFFERVTPLVGEHAVGARFIAITDPGSKMQHVAEGDAFRHTFFGVPSIGGRYAALSAFGLVPAAIMGVDIRQLLDHTEEMVHACAACVPLEQNPAVVLGTILGVAATKFGRDKVTLITSPGICDLGAWLEQLLAESTGKVGKGFIPVDREALGAPDVYGCDRVFVYLRLTSAPEAAQDAGIAALEHAGQPVVRIAVDDLYALGEEFFRWELATAVAGSILGINPFNQPDVEASKVATRTLTAGYEQTSALPPETPIFAAGGVKLFTDETNALVLRQIVGHAPSLAGYVQAHLNRLQAGDYFAVLGYIAMSDTYEQQLQAIRHVVRDRKHVATCLGFGPRFLHSTGQAYKGGPNSGVFLQITCENALDIPVPGQRYTFGVVKAAQARGDFHVLAERERRVLRVHLGWDVSAGLTALHAAIQQGLT